MELKGGTYVSRKQPLWQARYLQALCQAVSIPKFKEAIAWCLDLVTNVRAENKERLKALELILKYTIPPSAMAQLSQPEQEKMRVLEGEALAPGVLDALSQALRLHRAAQAGVPVVDRRGFEVGKSKSLEETAAEAPEPAGGDSGAVFPRIVGIVNDMPPTPYPGGP